jgi:hypothetical protein
MILSAWLRPCAFDASPAPRDRRGRVAYRHVRLLLAGVAFASEACFGATPLAQNYTVIWHNPDRESYVEGCGLVRLDDGSFVAVVPVVPRREWRSRRVEHSRVHIVRSDDRGATWKRASELPYYTAIPWTHAGKLYLFANKGGTTYRNDDQLLLRSDDGGRTWSPPVTLFKGHFWNCHAGIVVRNNTLYAATDNLALGSSYDLAVGIGNNVARGSCVVAGDLSRDPMDPAAWRISNTVPLVEIPRALVNPKFADAASYSHYLEPNVIEVQGRLRVLATVKPHRQTTANLGVVLDLKEQDGKLALEFSQYFPMPGGQLKYCVIWDDQSRMFWATSNLVVDSQGMFDWWEKGVARGNFTGGGGNDRRFLMLHYSLDGLNWFPAGCVAQAPKISQSFMYARPMIDGGDLAIISRSSVDAPNQHDADYATFHRVRNFRQLALKLVPEPEAK